VDLQRVGRDLSTFLGGDYVNRFSIQGRSYKVIPQVTRVERLTPEQLGDLKVTGADGKLVPLSTFATIKTSTQPRELKRFQQLNAVRIQGVIPPGVSLDQALQFLEKEAKASLPPGFSVDYAGESRQLRVEGSKFLATFLLSAILIYLVLAAQFESFRDPFIVLAGSVPLAISGALLFSFLGFTTLNIYSQVGLITLVGLVSKNGILIVEFANHLQETGVDKLKALVTAAGTRLRPILMTTAATVVGHMPLIYAKGPGAGARNSIGIMLVSGMIIGTAFTLFVVPSIYMLLARTRTKAAADEELEPTAPHVVVPELATWGMTRNELAAALGSVARPSRGPETGDLVVEGVRIAGIPFEARLFVGPRGLVRVFLTARSVDATPETVRRVERALASDLGGGVLASRRPEEREVRWTFPSTDVRLLSSRVETPDVNWQGLFVVFSPAAAGDAADRPFQSASR
jgi:hypothetical protein